MYKLVMYYGDDTPTARTAEWGTRVVQFADKSIGNQKFFTCYVAPKASTEAGKGAIETLIETYTTLFGSAVNKQTGAKSTLSNVGKQLLGERGRATLYLGDQELASWEGA